MPLVSGFCGLFCFLPNVTKCFLLFVCLNRFWSFICLFACFVLPEVTEAIGVIEVEILGFGKL